MIKRFYSEQEFEIFRENNNIIVNEKYYDSERDAERQPNKGIIPNVSFIVEYNVSYETSAKENMANESMYHGKSFKHSGFSIGKNIY